jgi:hypothetical protein
MAKKTAVEEPTKYATVGAFLHRDNGGKASVRAYTSVNEELKVDASDEVQKIGDVKVEFRVTENNNLNGSKIYQKDISTVQIPGNTNTQSTTATGSSDPLYNETPVSDGLSPLKVLKNFVDHIKEEQTMMWVVVGVSLVLGALALGLALR